MKTTDKLMSKASLEVRTAYAQERFIVRLGEQLIELMEQQGVSRAELASRLGRHKSEITRILQGRNVTAHTIARCFAALGCYVVPELEPLVRGRERSTLHTIEWPHQPVSQEGCAYDPNNDEPSDTPPDLAA